jgi:hypothetical protein
MRTSSGLWRQESRGGASVPRGNPEENSLAGFTYPFSVDSQTTLGASSHVGLQPRKIAWFPTGFGVPKGGLKDRWNPKVYKEKWKTTSQDEPISPAHHSQRKLAGGIIG